MKTTLPNSAILHSALAVAAVVATAATAAMGNATRPEVAPYPAGNGDFPLTSLGACAHVATADFADRAQVFAMMREAGLGCVRTDLGWRVGCVGISDDTDAAEAVASGLRKALPDGSTAEAFTPAGLCAALDTGALDAVVYPFSEAFPLETLEAVREFVANGGTLVDFGGVSEAQQADYILRALPVAAKHGVGAFFIYAFRTNEASPSDREAHYGIVHADYSPKEAYRTLRERVEFDP